MKVRPVLACLAALALAGCVGEAQAPSGPRTPTMQGDGMYAIHLVSGNVFLPADASIPVGSAVVWIADTGEHDVTQGREGEEPSWSSDDRGQPKLTRGARYERTFHDVGVIHYRCTLHADAGMVGTLTVTDDRT